MKLPLTQEIESSQKGIDYVNSLVPKDTKKIKKIDYKIFDDLEILDGVKIGYENDDFQNNKITKIYPTTNITKYVFEQALYNNLPELSRKFKRQPNHLAMFIFWYMVLGVALWVIGIFYLIKR